MAHRNSGQAGLAMLSDGASTDNASKGGAVLMGVIH